MRVIAAIAINVFRESVRDKVLYNLVFFAILMIGTSYLLGQLTAGQDVKIIKDLGLAATSVFGVFIAVFVGISLVSKEVDRRSVYPLLAKPISRGGFIVGKYLGLLTTLLVNTAVMTVALRGAVLPVAQRAGQRAAGVGRARPRPPSPPGHRAHLRRDRPGHRGRAVLLELLEPPAVGGIHARHLRGRAVQRRPEALQRDRRRSRGGGRGEGRLLRGAGPVEVRRQARRRPRRARGAAYMASASLYALVYIAALLFGATTIFARRDFK